MGYEMELRQMEKLELEAEVYSLQHQQHQEKETVDTSNSSLDKYLEPTMPPKSVSQSVVPTAPVAVFPRSCQIRKPQKASSPAPLATYTTMGDDMDSMVDDDRVAVTATHSEELRRRKIKVEATGEQTITNSIIDCERTPVMVADTGLPPHTSAEVLEEWPQHESINPRLARPCCAIWTIILRDAAVVLVLLLVVVAAIVTPSVEELAAMCRGAWARLDYMYHPAPGSPALPSRQA